MAQIRGKSLEKQPIGAVMVVGGGIAGMQASLDLAEQGFKEIPNRDRGKQ